MKRRVNTRLTPREIDYRQVEFLTKYLTHWGKIRPAKDTHSSARFQRALSRAVKNARYLGLLPYVKR